MSEIRVLVALFAAGFVELEGEAAVEFLRLFYAGTYVIGPEQQ